MIRDLCPLCGSLQTLDDGWLACACDRDLRRILTVRQAAAYLHMTPDEVYYLIDQGFLAAKCDSDPVQVRLTVVKFYKLLSYVARPPCHSPRQDYS